MTLTEGLLVVAVVMLTILVLRSRPKAHRESRVRSWDCVDRESGEVTSVKMKYTGPHGHGCSCPQCSNPEANATRENAEHFAGCANDTASKSALDCMCADGKDFEYATNDFGAPDMDFKDWVTSQAVDRAVLKNHAEFVQDRLDNERQTVTGRTYSPDSNDSYDPQPWLGIRGRPQAVAVCNPTQVSDMDVNLFEKKQKVVWSTS